MKILVCITKTPDTTTKISFKENNTRFNTDGVQFIINPLDEFVLTRALELREKFTGTVSVINVGLVDTEPIIRKAFAIGADDGIRVDADPADSYFVAVQLAHYAKEGNYDLIILGRETIDYNGSQIGGMLAELLGLPFVSGCPRLDVEGDSLNLDREIEGGKETLVVKMPCVASGQEGLTEPRIPTMRGIMSARTKPLKVVPAVSNELLTSAKVYELPPAKSGCKFVDAATPEKLVELLHSEAKVI
jgi:electron transfer flavoprotein beta subunit